MSDEMERGFKEIDKIVGANIRAQRTELQMSQEQLAHNLANVAVVTKEDIEAYETGQKRPNPLILERVAAILGVPMLTLFQRRLIADNDN